MQQSPFGRPDRWRHSDLIAASKAFDPALVEQAYRSGVFPMPTAGLMGWYSPLVRGILPLDGLRVTRSLRQAMRRYEIRIDSAFAAVMVGCADPDRPGGWIDANVLEVYSQLHDHGVAHSVEAWRDGQLVGGLYGISLGGLFAGESMFHRPDTGRDASKVALVALVDILRAVGTPGRLLDVQWSTPHLASLGVVEISRSEYLRRLQVALTLPAPVWPRSWDPR